MSSHSRKRYLDSVLKETQQDIEAENRRNNPPRVVIPKTEEKESNVNSRIRELENTIADLNLQISRIQQNNIPHNNLELHHASFQAEQLRRREIEQLRHDQATLREINREAAQVPYQLPTDIEKKIDTAYDKLMVNPPPIKKIKKVKKNKPNIIIVDD